MGLGRYLAADDLGGIAAVARALPDRRAAGAMLDRALSAALGDEGRLAGSLHGEDAALLVSRIGARRRKTGLRDLERDLCIVLLGRLRPPELGEAMPALLPFLAVPERAGAVEGLLARLPADTAVRCLLAAAGARGVPAGAAAELDRIRETYAAALAGRGAVPLGDGEAEQIAGRVAERLPELQLREWRGDAKRAGRRYGSWWTGLEARRRKRARP